MWLTRDKVVGALEGEERKTALSVIMNLKKKKKNKKQTPD